ncbi:ATP-dependent DNA helicase MER3 [Gnomoniopsis smithogilvyi]|uniref:DNA 3'-5' helicase n=1 Tax=Gnomoniopsis smithogilvyi TaxID=1191159 RepID=A0A9W8YY20_9PEZI|nr:ATP-dependent DNA helicase MER3 [Gnomoniopsis smithogilvyi]
MADHPTPQADQPPPEASQPAPEAPAKKVYKRKRKPENPAWAAFQTIRPEARKLMDTAARDIGGVCTAVSHTTRPDAQGRSLETPYVVKHMFDEDQEEGYLIGHSLSGATRSDMFGRMMTKGYRTYTADEVPRFFMTDGGEPDKKGPKWKPLTLDVLLGRRDSSGSPVQNSPGKDEVKLANGSANNHSIFNGGPSINPMQIHNSATSSAINHINNQAMNGLSTNGIGENSLACQDPSLNGYFINNPVPHGPNLNGVINNSQVPHGLSLNGFMNNGQVPHVPSLNGYMNNGQVPQGPSLNGFMNSGQVPHVPSLNGFMDNGQVPPDPSLNGFMNSGQVPHVPSLNGFMDNGQVPPDPSLNGLMSNCQVPIDPNMNGFMDNGQVPPDPSLNGLMSNCQVPIDPNMNGFIHNGQVPHGTILNSHATNNAVAHGPIHKSHIFNSPVSHGPGGNGHTNNSLIYNYPNINGYYANNMDPGIYDSLCGSSMNGHVGNISVPQGSNTNGHTAIQPIPHDTHLKGPAVRRKQGSLAPNMLGQARNGFNTKNHMKKPISHGRDNNGRTNNRKPMSFGMNTNGQAANARKANGHMCSTVLDKSSDTKVQVMGGIQTNGNISSSPVISNTSKEGDASQPDLFKPFEMEQDNIESKITDVLADFCYSGNDDFEFSELFSTFPSDDLPSGLEEGYNANSSPLYHDPMVSADGADDKRKERLELPLNAVQMAVEKNFPLQTHALRHGHRTHECLDSSSVPVSAHWSPAASSSRRQEVRMQSSNATSENVPVPRDAPSPTCNVLPNLTVSRAPLRAHGIELLNPNECIPDRFHSVFPYDLFNAVQSKCFKSVYTTDENLIVSAPTGSGKTVLFELAICKLANQRDNENAKIVYIAPTKALCREKAEQWRKKFSMISMPVSELTGDTSRAEMRAVRMAKIIITTPEKWDSITRSWVDHRKLLDMVELFLIDEVHILKEFRGATLEAIVSRMKTYGSKVRFVALSATIPNSADIASWLGRDCENSSMSARREVFGEEFRPVKLQKFVHGFDAKLTGHAFDTYLNSRLWKYIEMHTQKKPMLVFCITRKSCRSAAEELAKQWRQRQPSARLWPQPSKRISVIDASLQELVSYGVAFHHAGLEPDDRKAILQGFEQGHLSVICCTSTLAIGVNLPCHTVVLKGTVSYQDGGQLCEYSDLEVMQMLGRAGRPQYEDSAVAIILTRSCNKTRYDDLGSGGQILESTLHKNLIEHLNSEITLGTFQDLSGASRWLKGTFLSVRLQRNPRYYDTLTSDKGTPSQRNLINFDDQLEQICETAISNLRDVGLIKGDAMFQHTDYGRAMSKYMVSFETMKMILEIQRGAKVSDILNALCEAHEFNEIRWQPNERELFRVINRDPFIMHPIETTVSTVAHKISLLIQMELGRVELPTINGFERQRLRAETGRVLDLMNRLIRTVIECKGSDSDGPACWAALELARSMAAKAWEDKPMQLLQVPQLGPALMRKLVSHNIRTVSQLASSDPSDIERIASRNPPFGRKMADSIVCFPRLTIDTIVKDTKVGPDGNPVVHVDGKLGFKNARGKWRGKMPIVTFLAVTTEGISSHFFRESLSAFDQNDSSHQIHFTWNPQNFQDTLICRFACEEIVGTAVSTKLYHNLPASAFLPRTTQYQPPPANVHRTVPLRASPVCRPIEDEIDDADMLVILENVVRKVESSQRDKVEVDAGEDDFVAMLNDNSNTKLPSKLPPAPKGVQKREQDFLMKLDKQKLGKAVASSYAGQQKPCVTAKKQQPPLRRSSGQGVAPQAHDGGVVKEDPVRLANGRYKCGHPCSQFGGGTTVRGVKCGHDCCRNGSKYPPKRYNSSGKRKEQCGDEAKSSAQSVQDFTSSKPPLKRARNEEAFQSKAGNSSSPLPQKNVLSDLSLCDVDDEGMIDLISDPETASNVARCARAPNTSNPGSSLARASSKVIPKSFDNLLDELPDDDLITIDAAMELTHPDERSTTCARHPRMVYESILELSSSLPESKEEDISKERGRCDDQCRLDSTKPRLARSETQVTIDATSSQSASVSVPQDAKPVRNESMAVGLKEASEPQWVNDFDPALISEFRGLVDFI